MLSSFPYETWGANFDLQRPTEAGHGEEPGYVAPGGPGSLPRLEASPRL